MTEKVETTVNQGQGFEQLDREIIGLYKHQIGNDGIDKFKGGVIPIARQVLADRPGDYRDTLHTLVTAASQKQPHSRLDAFWDSEVTDDTFRFQRDYSMLSQPNKSRVEGFVFHLNYRKLLEEDLKEGKLTPQDILEGYEFDAVDEEKNPDYYRVCFASGNVDELSKFLAGFALVSKTHMWEEGDYFNPNNLLVPRTLRIAVARQSDTKFTGDHDMMTLYSPEGNGELVQVFVANEPIPVQILKIPSTVLLPTQVAKLKTEGAELFRRGEFYTGNSQYPPENEEQAGNNYALSRHQELAIKYTLLKFAAQPQLKPTT